MRAKPGYLSPKELLGQLCELACSNSHLDLCNVRQLPGNPVRDASDVFPMNWRFLPPLDPQVETSPLQVQDVADASSLTP